MRGDVEAVKSLITAGVDVKIRDMVRPQTCGGLGTYHFPAEPPQKSI